MNKLFNKAEALRIVKSKIVKMDADIVSRILEYGCELEKSNSDECIGDLKELSSTISVDVIKASFKKIYGDRLVRDAMSYTELKYIYDKSGFPEETIDMSVSYSEGTCIEVANGIIRYCYYLLAKDYTEEEGDNPFASYLAKVVSNGELLREMGYCDNDQLFDAIDYLVEQLSVSRKPVDESDKATNLFA